MNVICRIMRTFAQCYVKNVTCIALEALYFFHTENFDNSHEIMEKQGRSSLGTGFIGPIPLTSYRGVSCSSNLFIGKSKAIGGLADTESHLLLSCYKSMCE